MVAEVRVDSTQGRESALGNLCLVAGKWRLRGSASPSECPRQVSHAKDRVELRIDRGKVPGRLRHVAKQEPEIVSVQVFMAIAIRADRLFLALKTTNTSLPLIPLIERCPDGEVAD